MYFLKRLLRRPSPYQSLITISIEGSKLLANYRYLQNKKADDTIIPVLKSNAYGHGLKQVCQVINQLSTQQCPLVAVDSFPEYQIVRDYSDKEILIMGETLGDNYRLYQPKRTHIAIGSLHSLKALIATNKPYRIHLFLNTGMNREGLQLPQLKQALALLHDSKLTITGIMSHFAMADCLDATFNDRQIDTFKQFYQLIKTHPKLSSTHVYKHIANSAGIAKVSDSFFTTWRAGIALYGYNPCEPTDSATPFFDSLQPALSVQARITALQQLTAGAIVSYGGLFVAKQDCTVATLPIGYEEGLNRKLSGQRTAQYNRHTLQQVGNICMNISSRLLPPHCQTQIGDQVTIFSSDRQAPNSVAAAASLAEIIPYQVLTQLDPKIKRILV